MMCERCGGEVEMVKPWQKYCKLRCARADRIERYWTKRLNLGGINGASKDAGGGH